MIKLRYNLFWLFVVSGIGLAGVGCGDKTNQVVKVKGTLTYKGNPVPNVLLHFLPERGRQSWAETDEEGRFTIRYDSQQDGAVVGHHKVWIEKRPTSRAEKEAALRGEQLQTQKEWVAFFSKYSQEKSEHKIEVTPQTRELLLALD